jgi:FtsH-binding integral membrane protein
MLLDIVKQIVAKNGKQILLDPQKVSAFFSDMAKDVPELPKKTFIECLKDGVVSALENAAQNKEELADCKKILAERLYTKERRDIKLYKDAIDILCEVLFGCTPDSTLDYVATEMPEFGTNKKIVVKPEILSKRTTAEAKTSQKMQIQPDIAQEQLVKQKHDEESATNITLIATVLTLLITLVSSVFFNDLILGKPWRLLVCFIVILCLLPWSHFSWQRLKLILGPMIGLCLGSIVGNWLYAGAVSGSIGIVVGVIFGRLGGDWGFRNPDRITIQKLITYFKLVSVRWIVIVIVVTLFVVLLVKVEMAQKVQLPPLKGTRWEYINPDDTSKYLMEYDKDTMIFTCVNKYNATLVSQIKLRYTLNDTDLTIIDEKGEKHRYNYSGTYIKFKDTLVYTQLISSAQTRR